MSDTLRAEPPEEPWRVRLAVLLGYLALGLLSTWPLAAHMGSHVIQRGPALVDAGQGVWNMWWVRAALLSGQNPYLTSAIFYPERVNLFWQTLSLPNALLTLPVLLPAGPVAAANLLTLLSFGLGGYALYRLALGVCGGRAGALLAGAAFVCAPFHMQMILGGPLEIIAVHWIPLYLLLLLRALRRPGLARGLAAAAGLLLTSLASQYYGLYCAVYSAFHIALAALLASAEPGGPPARGLRLRLLGSGLLIALVWAGVLLLFTGAPASVGAAAPEDWLERQLYHSVALVDFLAPNVLHPLWGAAVARWLAPLHPFGVESGALPGVTVLLLALAGLRGAWRRAWPWLLLALLAAVCAMGPRLQITDTPTGVPLLFSLFDLAGPFKNSSRPAYFVPVMLVPVCVLAALGLQTLQRLARVRAARAWLLPGLAAALVLGELLVGPWPLLPARPAAFAAALPDGPPGAVLELPPQNDRSQYMVNQICHGRPLAGGYLARTPDYPAAAFPSALQRLWEAAPPAPDIFAAAPAAELGALGVRYVVLHPESITRRHAEAVRATLAQAPQITRVPAPDAEVYLVPADPPAALALPGAGWYPVEQQDGRVWRWIGAQAELRLLARAPLRATLRLRAAALARERPLRLELDGRPLAELRVPPGPPEQELLQPLELAPGPHTLRLLSPADPVADGRRLSLLLTGVALDTPPVAPQALSQPPATLPRVCGR